MRLQCDLRCLRKVIPQERKDTLTNKIGISLDDETLTLCDKYAAENSRSRSEFIALAIQKYVSDLELGRQKNIIAKELADEIIKGSEAGVTKISKGLFRYAVEVEMIIMILSELTNIPPKIMEEYRKEAVRNVRRTRGKINLDDLISRNNRELVESKLLKKVMRTIQLLTRLILMIMILWRITHGKIQRNKGVFEGIF